MIESLVTVRLDAEQANNTTVTFVTTLLLLGRHHHRSSLQPNDHPRPLQRRTSFHPIWWKFH